MFIPYEQTDDGSVNVVTKEVGKGWRAEIPVCDRQG